MIYDYAVEPSLVVSWHELKDYRHYVKMFGLGTPRILAEYPAFNKWRESVFQGSLDSGLEGLDLQRVTALVKLLEERYSRRQGFRYDKGVSWLQNAEKEHKRFPFEAILACDNSSVCPDVYTDEQINSALIPAWEKPVGVVAIRKPKALSDAVKSILQKADEILFVDPWFVPDSPKHNRVMKTFFRILVDERPTLPRRVEVHAFDTIKKGGDRYFLQEAAKLGEGLSKKMIVRFFRYSRGSENEEKIHNRYILADIGGVIFGTGLTSDNKNSETEDINLLAKEQYLYRWELFNERKKLNLVKEPLKAIIGG